MPYKYFNIEFNHVEQLSDLRFPINIFLKYVDEISDHISAYNFNKYYQPPSSPHPSISIRFNTEEPELVKEIILQLSKKLLDNGEIRSYDKEIHEWTEPDFVVKAHELGTLYALDFKNRIERNSEMYKKFLNKSVEFMVRARANILNNYFKKNSCPYDWFEHLDLLLQKIDCSYYANKWDNISLHTDICTPLATNPTWSDFKKTKLSKLIENEGRSIWHNLIKILLPDVVLMSFSKKYLNKIEYLDITNVEILYTFSKKKDGEDRKKPYDILLYREVINGKQVNFLYGEGNVKPFLISDKQKFELGNEIKKIV